MRFTWILIAIGLVSLFSCNQRQEQHLSITLNALPAIEEIIEPPSPSDLDSIKILNSTFLGGSQRNYYGDYIDTSLTQLWKHKLGQGETVLGKGRKTWSGAGWTGQPLVVKEKDSTFLVIGCYDHHLKKINATTGKLVWQYKYDDVIKGTGTIIRNDSATDPNNRFVILQGSRRGLNNSLSSKHVFSYRAISYITGQELWRMNIPRDKGWSRDVDASALILNDTAYIGLENGTFRVFDPFETIEESYKDSSWIAPKVYQEHKLYVKDDRRKHGGNLVTESSPAMLGNHVYIASGSGHLFGYNLLTDTIDFDFYIGSDIDGSPVVTSDSCILVTVEKQYIKGHGGVFKIDPSKPDTNCVVWYYPTGDNDYADWKGGIIGSASINDSYGNDVHLAAVTGIDGVLTVFNHQELGDSLTHGPNNIYNYPTPKVMFQKYIGPSISTPVFTSSHLLAAGYKGLNLFSYDSLGIVSEVKSIKGVFEATPSVHNGNVYIASRNGYLYCFGKELEKFEEVTKVVELNQLASVDNKIITTQPPVSDNSKTPTLAIHKDNPKKTYHVIVGIYSQSIKAERFAKKLREMNFTPYIFEKGNTYYLSAKSSNQKEILKEDLNNIASLTETSAWIFPRN